MHSHEGNKVYDYDQKNKSGTSTSTNDITKSSSGLSKIKKDEKPKPNAGTSSLTSRIEASKKRLLERDIKREEEKGRGGLNVEIHPLLRKNVPLEVSSVDRRQHPSRRKGFEEDAFNPYIRQEDFSLAYTQQKKSRPLNFNTQGVYIAKANELRERERQVQEAKRREEEREKKGLSVIESLGEGFYKIANPPSVEWWDKGFLRKSNYDNLGPSDIVYDNEDSPVSMYIQHPVLPTPQWEVHMPSEKPMYLIKKELKRIRRNERLQRNQMKQDRIRLGLDPPPPPKVRLSNLMNVLTNEAIQDPTLVEKKVRLEVQGRISQHLRQNEERRLAKEDTKSKVERKYEDDLQKGYFTTVYKINRLLSPKHFYKVDINAKESMLNGVCLLNPEFCLVVVEGGAKSINFYKKLMLRRIDWTKYEKPKDSSDCEEYEEDLSQNKCSIVWEGQIKDLHFQKWSVARTESEEEALSVLYRYGIDNYWKEAHVIDK